MSRIIKPRKPGKYAVSEYEHSDLEDAIGSDNGRDPAAILARAREEAQRTLHEAYQEGLQKGIEDGREKFQDSVGGSAQMLSRAAETLQKARQEFLDELEPQMVQLASTIASKIIDHETQMPGELVKRTTRSVLERVMAEERVALHVNPRDLDTLREYRVDLMAHFEGITKLELVPDDSIAPGGCIAVTDHLRVDGRLTAQLEQIVNELMD